MRQPRLFGSAGWFLFFVVASGCAEKAAPGVKGDSQGAAGSVGSAPPVIAKMGAPDTTGSPSAGTAGSAAGVAAQAAPVTSSSLPCDVARVVAAHCTSCHAAVPLLGARMPLVSWEDFQRPAVTDANRKVYEIVRTRVMDMQNPMPPSSAGTLETKDIALLAAWSERGAPRANATDSVCNDVPDAGSVMALAPAPVANQKDATCYDLTVHGTSAAGDTTPFMIPTGETYHCFYFDAPWPQAALSVAFRSKLDTAQALHHWFLYAMPTATANGTVETCLPLHVDGPKMIAGWAPGGKDMAMPDGVGAELAAPGSTLMLEWHYFNNTNAEISDKSSVSICTVPVGSRPNVAAMTWLGTENFGLGMPAHAMSSFTGTCQPSRTGLGASDPIHLLYTIPHMHQFGRHMRLEIQRAGGNVTVFDQPFSEKNQAWVATPADVLAGDALLTTCTYENTSDSAVGYGGPFDNAEMCYAFVLGYPAHALDNGTRSLLGASNSCL